MKSDVKIQSRHLTFDLYNCRAMEKEQAVQFIENLPEIIKEQGYNVISTTQSVDDAGHIAAMIILAEGHFSIHFYRELKYAACDFYVLLPGAKPEKMFKAVKKLLRPDKVKTIFLKRGDFGTVADMKPKIKVRFAPLRKIKNTGAKMIKLLARK